ncbi:tumor necrosis factor receptor superfamily member 11A-like isoform X1 [Astyanax mexicanus]|uniref:Tumor necrosis factor receptor superfamily member 11A-like isoform X1 n=1 Tax=Astyanax mexicanus TaxID=7994 RepID=A0A8T2MMR0_ASTMX|nr:tumor necrosis factor receptor superfamily member 11A-like isoform X1 [Astyanax mexicanus]
MRVHFSTSWIFRGWITCLIFALCIQRKDAKPTCNQTQYLKDNKCCNKCGPGSFLITECSGNADTICRQCGKNEYQSEYTTDKRCIPQKFCDDGKGFYRPTPSSTTELEPCRCKDGFQCHPLNCEFCEPIPSCPAGQGLKEVNGKKFCKECRYGYFSDSNVAEPCKMWTNCKSIGKTEEKPGSTKKDVTCGPPFEIQPVPPTSWAVVAVPCVIIVIFVIILSCYKDKLNILSGKVNLRTCIQNIKRSRIQQETLAPPYHSNVLQSGSEITSRLIKQDDSPPEYLSLCSELKPTGNGASDPKEDQEPDSVDSVRDRADGLSSGSSDVSEGGPASPLSGSSCSCLPSMKEPMEVGENEDCSQLVATGLAGCCSCGLGETMEAKDSTVDAAVSLKEPPMCGNCYSDSMPGCLQGSQELYLDYSSPVGKETMSEVGGYHSDGSLYKHNEPRCCSIESTVPPKSAFSNSNNGGLSLIADDNLLDPETDLEIQSQCSDATLACGQVTGNNNTTFISTGQVMNFTGDVIMVYVSQTSLGSGCGGDEPYANPVQEESSEIHNASKSNTHTQQHDFPVQEMTTRRLQQNISV